MKIIVDTEEKISEYVAEEFSRQLASKPQSVFAFTADESLKPLLNTIDGCFETASFFNVCDFCLNENESDKSMMQKLSPVLEKLSFKEVHSPDPAAPEEYDAHIALHGGVDLLLLGMGLNGAVGFNEPTTLYDSYTHIAKLTDTTKRSVSECFGGAENVPDTGVTMGLKTICGAAKVIVAAFGIDKAEIVHKLVYGKTTTYVPAAMLQMHRDMILCLDAEAASKL